LSIPRFYGRLVAGSQSKLKRLHSTAQEET
jgi:hypothetical protein